MTTNTSCNTANEVFILTTDISAYSDMEMNSYVFINNTNNTAKNYGDMIYTALIDQQCISNFDTKNE
eukprot:scaffold191493_cov20-Prasinocladus_malaysianus.AAC.1